MSLARKVKRTVHQRGLDREGRQRNLTGAFIATGPVAGPVAPAHSRAVVLVDDVYTTGATVAEVSRAILARWESPYMSSRSDALPQIYPSARIEAGGAGPERPVGRSPQPVIAPVV